MFCWLILSNKLHIRIYCVFEHVYSRRKAETYKKKLLECQVGRTSNVEWGSRTEQEPQGPLAREGGLYLDKLFAAVALDRI